MPPGEQVVTVTCTPRESGALSLVPKTNTLVGEATRLSHWSHIGAAPRRSTPLIRLKAPLAERYTETHPRRPGRPIAAAKAATRDRLFILGHHYQCR